MTTKRFPGLAKEMMDRQRAAAVERPAPSCERCGCTDAAACSAGCTWIRPGLCSNCASHEELADAGLLPVF